MGLVEPTIQFYSMAIYYRWVTWLTLFEQSFMAVIQSNVLREVSLYFATEVTQFPFILPSCHSQPLPHSLGAIPGTALYELH